MALWLLLDTLSAMGPELAGAAASLHGAERAGGAADATCWHDLPAGVGGRPQPSASWCPAWGQEHVGMDPPTCAAPRLPHSPTPHPLPSQSCPSGGQPVMQQSPSSCAGPASSESGSAALLFGKGDRTPTGEPSPAHREGLWRWHLHPGPQPSLGSSPTAQKRLAQAPLAGMVTSVMSALWGPPAAVPFSQW